MYCCRLIWVALVFVRPNVVGAALPELIVPTWVFSDSADFDYIAAKMQEIVGQISGRYVRCCCCVYYGGSVTRRSSICNQIVAAVEPAALKSG